MDRLNNTESLSNRAYPAARVPLPSYRSTTPTRLGGPSAGNAAVGQAGRALRRPWYAFWKWVERGWYTGRDYSLAIPYGYRVFTPWFSTDDSSEFARMVRSARAWGPLTKSADRCYMLYQLSRSALRFSADWAECGVHTGGTAHLLSLIADRRPRRLHLFDTFKGVPSTALHRRDYHSPGDFSDTSLDLVQRRLDRFPFVAFHPGEIPSTFERVGGVPSYSFVHVDVDIYPAVLACCEWFWPRLCAGGSILFNDYGIYPYRYAAKAAVDSFFTNVNDGSLIILPTGQAVAFKH
jgi:O-methyltransferase